VKRVLFTLLLVITIILVFVVTLADNQIITTYEKPKVGIFSDDPDIFPEEVHIVKSGDSIWSIANLYGVSRLDLMRKNNLTNSLIVTGDEIIIPERTYYITKRNLNRHVASFENLVQAIYIAEGGEKARVPYGATSFHDSGSRHFANTRTQYLFELLQADFSPRVGSKEYYRIVTIVTVFYYWENYIHKHNLQQKYFDKNPSDVQNDFIHYLGSYYAPVSASPLNKSWVKNVRYYLWESD